MTPKHGKNKTYFANYDVIFAESAKKIVTIGSSAMTSSPTPKTKAKVADETKTISANKVPPQPKVSFYYLTMTPMTS